MQTRKKSISLHALGIIPTARTTHRSASSSSVNNTTPSDSHPAKRLKRSHTLSTTVSSITSPSSPSTSYQRRRNASATGDEQRPQPTLHTTPPPSPGSRLRNKVDTSGINDDVVVAVVEQLESTGNRPHQIKELATVLAGNLRVVDSSCNPVAIISSRLTNYLRRPWTAIAPCPLAKEQVNIHPRRVYYYLTTCPRQSIPEVAEHLRGPSRIISPSISSGPDEEELDVPQLPERKRDPMSASPEVELSLPDLDMSGMTYTDPVQPAYSAASETHQDYTDSRRAASPALEHDEREFTHTASVMATRAQSSQIATPNVAVSESKETSEPFPRMDLPVAQSPEHMVKDVEESDAVLEQRNQEAAAALFGHGNEGGQLHTGFSSPVFRPKPGKESLVVNTSWSSTAKPSADASYNYTMSDFGAWGDLKSPETVGLKELDDLLGDF